MLRDAQVLDAPEIDGAAAAERAEDAIAALEQELREVGAVLAGDAGDDGRARAGSCSCCHAVV